MRATVLLADYAVVTPDGKVTAVGAGWDQLGAGAQSAVAVLVEVEWTETNERFDIRLDLMDEDSQLVMLPTTDGMAPIQIANSIEVGRPPGVKHGRTFHVPFCVNIAPLPLVRPKSYVWRLFVKPATSDEWTTEETWARPFFAG